MVAPTTTIASTVMVSTIETSTTEISTIMVNTMIVIDMIAHIARVAIPVRIARVTTTSGMTIDTTINRIVEATTAHIARVMLYVRNRDILVTA